MSRLMTMSPAALRAMFAPESDADLIVLLTLSGANIGPTPIRLADGYTQRLSETDEDVIYGVRSRGADFLFLPMQITLPTDEHASAPRCNVSLYDVTQRVLPSIRQLVGAPSVLLEVVLSSSPDTVECSFPGLFLSGIEYDADVITGELSTESDAVEPFPSGTFTPSICPGLF